MAIYSHAQIVAYLLHDMKSNPSSVSFIQVEIAIPFCPLQLIVLGIM